MIIHKWVDNRNPLATAMENQDVSLTDLLEVRMGLETNAAALATLRADEKTSAFSKKASPMLEEQIRNGELGNEADVSFHMDIACAIKNPVQIYLMKSFIDFLFIGIKENLGNLYEGLTNIDQIFKQHVAIIQAIKTSRGRQCRDLFMSLIHTCRLAGVDTPWATSPDC